MTKVLVVVFDGLQPAQVTEGLMPNLAAFAASGVTFANHHAVYPTVTRANASSMVTGRNPGGHGLSANTLLVRDYDPNQAIPAMEPQLDRCGPEDRASPAVPDPGRGAFPTRPGIRGHRRRYQRQRLPAQPHCRSLRRRHHPPGVYSSPRPVRRHHRPLRPLA